MRCTFLKRLSILVRLQYPAFVPKTSGVRPRKPAQPVAFARLLFRKCCERPSATAVSRANGKPSLQIKSPEPKGKRLRTVYMSLRCAQK